MRICIVFYRQSSWFLLLYLDLATNWYLNIIFAMNWNLSCLISCLIFWCDKFLYFQILALSPSSNNMINIRLIFILINYRLVLIRSFSHIKNFCFLDWVVVDVLSLFGNWRSFFLIWYFKLTFSSGLILSVWNIELFFILLLNIFHAFKFRSYPNISVNLIS
jgi:hypothetical protein